MLELVVGDGNALPPPHAAAQQHTGPTPLLLSSNEIRASCKGRVCWLEGIGCAGRVPSYPTLASRHYFIAIFTSPEESG